jgi:hypothetical protein
MNTKDDGGPAFPETTDEWDRDSDRYRPVSIGGMTLRDYFAAKALAPLVRTVQKNGKTGPDAGEDDFVWVARRAYMLADEMLKARQQ